MPTAVIVDAVRSAGGKRNGALSGWHPADLAAEVLAGLYSAGSSLTHRLSSGIDRNGGIGRSVTGWGSPPQARWTAQRSQPVACAVCRPIGGPKRSSR